MVPNIEKDHILLLEYSTVFYIRDIILLGSTTKKTLLKSGTDVRNLELQWFRSKLALVEQDWQISFQGI